MLGGDIEIGSGEQNDPLGPRRAGGPNFLAVHQIMITLKLGLALDGSQVGTVVWFGVTGTPSDLAVQNIGDELFLLLFRAVFHDAGTNPGQAHH